MRRSDTFVRGSINGGRRSSVGARLLGREDEEAAVGLRDLTSTTDTDTDSDDGHRR
jgi:hypothetical protein